MHRFHCSYDLRPNRCRGATLLACSVLVALIVSAAGLAALHEETLSPRQILDNLAAKNYTGHRIDLVFSGAGLQEVIAALEKAGGVRLELDPRIDDRVTYRLAGVPWDEALAAVLADNALHIAPNLEGTGFKIGRGRQVVLALENPGRAKFVLFLYKHLLHIAAGIALLAAVAAGSRVYRQHRSRRRAAGKKPLLPAAVTEQVKEKLVRLLRDERVYLDEDLTLQSLAERLAVTSHQLSWIINEELRVSFPSLVNGYRVEEVKRRLADHETDGTSILQIALEAGFNTKASFNRAFKIATGMTPSQYKRSLSR